MVGDYFTFQSRVILSNTDSPRPRRPYRPNDMSRNDMDWRSRDSAAQDAQDPPLRRQDDK